MMQGDAASNDPQVREQLAGVAHFLRKALRFWPELVLMLMLGAAAFLVFLHFYQPRFRSETVMLYVEKGDSTQDVESSEAQRSITVRLKELLYARPTLQRVVEQFDLYPELRRSYGMVDAVEELKKRVEFKAPGGDTFSVGFEGASASEAKSVTTELARLVIEGDAELRKQQAKVALDFLAGERQARDKELKQAEEKLASFMVQHPRFALDATPLASGAAIRATLGSSVLPGAVAARGLAAATPEARATSALAGALAVTPMATAAPSADEVRARAALAAARQDLTDKLAHYTPAHPDVRAAEAAVQRANEQLAAVTARAPASAAIAATAPAPTPSVTASAASVPAPARRSQWVPPAPAAPHTEGLVELETEWLKLTRAVTEARQRLDQIEEQLFRADVEVSSETGGHAVQVSVIDPAFLPQRPVPPGVATLALIFAGAALVIGLLVMLVRATFDDRVFDARDFRAPGFVLAEVPRAHARRPYVAR